MIKIDQCDFPGVHLAVRSHAGLPAHSGSLARRQNMHACKFPCQQASQSTQVKVLSRSLQLTSHERVLTLCLATIPQELASLPIKAATFRRWSAYPTKRQATLQLELFWAGTSLNFSNVLLCRILSATWPAVEKQSAKELSALYA